MEGQAHVCFFFFKSFVSSRQPWNSHWVNEWMNEWLQNPFPWWKTHYSSSFLLGAVVEMRQTGYTARWNREWACLPAAWDWVCKELSDISRTATPYQKCEDEGHFIYLNSSQGLLCTVRRWPWMNGLGLEEKPLPLRGNVSLTTEAAEVPAKERGSGYFWGLVLLIRVWELRNCHHLSPFAHTRLSLSSKWKLSMYLKTVWGTPGCWLALGSRRLALFLLSGPNFTPVLPATCLPFCGLGLSSPLGFCVSPYKAWSMFYLSHVSPTLIAPDITTCFLFWRPKMDFLYLLQARVHEDGITTHFSLRGLKLPRLHS